MPKVEIDVVPVGELVTYAQTALRLARGGGRLPIPPHLAAAQSHNPYADPEDPGLLVARIGDQCVGHIGLIPGRVQIDGRNWKVYWGSALFVDEAHRKSGVGTFLISRLLSLDIDFVGAEMSRTAERMWRLIGLTKVLGPRTVYSVQLDRVRSAVGVRASLPQWMEPVGAVIGKAMEVCYPFLRRLLYLALLRPFRRSLRGVTVSPVDQLPPEFDDIGTPNDSEKDDHPVEFQRGLEWINWKLAHPWILPEDQVSPELSEVSDQYYFDLSRPLFALHAFTFREQATGTSRGYLLISVSASRRHRHTQLKVLDASRDLNAELALAMAFRVGWTYQADLLVFSEKLGRRLAETWIGRRLLRREVHEYACRPRKGSQFEQNLHRVTVDICDGDYSFT
ncbi:MAG: GNAT family N-acetyltransferase [Gemmatimonadota bacterium]